MQMIGGGTLQQLRAGGAARLLLGVGQLMRHQMGVGGALPRPQPDVLAVGKGAGADRLRRLGRARARVDPHTRQIGAQFRLDPRPQIGAERGARAGAGHRLGRRMQRAGLGGRGIGLALGDGVAVAQIGLLRTIGTGRAARAFGAGPLDVAGRGRGLSAAATGAGGTRPAAFGTGTLDMVAAARRGGGRGGDRRRARRRAARHPVGDAVRLGLEAVAWAVDDQLGLDQRAILGFAILGKRVLRHPLQIQWCAPRRRPAQERRGLRRRIGRRFAGFRLGQGGGGGGHGLRAC